jgi:aldose 1-epimerase
VPSDVVTLRSGPLAIGVDPADGCRLTSFAVGDHELLFDGEDRPADDPIGDLPFGWGSFVMAPWAGRIRHGHAHHAGHDLQLTELADDGHALHGLVHSRRWDTEVVDDRAGRWRTHVPGTRWFGPLTVAQQLAVTDDRVTLLLEVTTDGPATPATVGWHPWFRRDVAGHRASVHLPAGATMLARDAQGIATTTEVAVPDGAWDDAFVGADDGPVVVRWPGLGDLEVTSDAAVTVVFTELPYAVCVEPQTGPPDEVNGASPRLVTPDRPLVLTSTWRWVPATS